MIYHIKTVSFFFCISAMCIIAVISKPLYAEKNTVSTDQPILIVRGDGEYPPYEMTRNGVLEGFHIEMIQKTAERLNIKTQIKSVPWKRALKMMENGEADAITYIGKTPEREKYVYFSDGNILSSVKMSFIILSENKAKIPYSGKLEDLSQYTILTIRGFIYGEKFDNASYLTKYNVDSYRQIEKMLMMKRYQVAIVNVDDFTSSAMGTGSLNHFYFLSPNVSEINNYIGFSKSRNRKDLAALFAAEMIRFKESDSYAQLLKKYKLK